MAGLRRTVSVLVPVLLAFVACSEGPTGSRTSPIESWTPTTSPSGPPDSRSQTIEVDWRDPGISWPTLFRLPYGPARELPGIARFAGQEPILPSALAVLPDGGFALLDPAKRRIVALDGDGQLVNRLASASQVASDLVWDPAGERIVWIDNESTGTVAEIELDSTGATSVTTDRSISRLVPTDSGVEEFGSPSYDAAYGYTHVPAPLEPHETAAEGAGMQLPDGGYVEFESNRHGDRWHLERPGNWAVELGFEGSDGPMRPAVPLRDDIAVFGQWLIMSPLVGSYSVDPQLGKRLLLLIVDLNDGTVTVERQLAQCGLQEDANLVSRITIDYATGRMFQLCSRGNGIVVRRGPILG